MTSSAAVSVVESKTIHHADTPAATASLRYQLSDRAHRLTSACTNRFYSSAGDVLGRETALAARQLTFEQRQDVFTRC